MSCNLSLTLKIFLFFARQKPGGGRGMPGEAPKSHIDILSLLWPKKAKTIKSGMAAAYRCAALRSVAARCVRIRSDTFGYKRAFQISEPDLL